MRGVVLSARVGKGIDVLWFFVALATIAGVTVEELGEMGLRAVEKKVRS